ncbi:hypothetical protein C1H46_038381 [Malus baccata]|uniref:Uncharacterized protein n=1 Tax=Malus baccata TaxID=106549 RepID=A0A540KPF8_MALBA|nr:hypothetical protein C1H46_038381 [Malus baccata]
MHTVILMRFKSGFVGVWSRRSKKASLEVRNRKRERWRRKIYIHNMYRGKEKDRRVNDLVGTLVRC